LAAYTLTRRNRVRVLEVSGAVNHAGACRFRAELDRLTADPEAGPVIVDLGALEMISSAGMRLLVQCQRSLAERGTRMVTVGLCGIARETVEMCGIDRLLETAPSLQDALESLECPPG